MVDDRIYDIFYEIYRYPTNPSIPEVAACTGRID